MTYFIDVSGHQAGLDMRLVAPAGNEAVIVKAVAAYRPEHTVADGYHAHIDAVIAAGLPKGHYFVPNSQNSPKQLAAFAAANLHRPAPGDVFMLDNEPLDTYKTFWRDDAVMEFFEEFVRLTGASWSQLWLYCPASLTRSSGPWTRVEEARKTRGLKIVWVSYGDNDPLREAGEEPLLGGGITGWDVHQFTSTYRIAGWGGNLDRNFSPHSIADLFGGGTMEDQMRRFIAANRKPADAATWDQMCGSLMFRFNSWRGWVSRPVRDISSAYRASQGSTIISTDFMRAPVGAFHFFDIAGPANGHVMQDARGGGLVCLSTGYALSESLGNAIGFQSVPGYVAAKGARYIGWSRDYAGGTINVSGLSGGGYDPIEEDDMFNDNDRATLTSILVGLGVGGIGPGGIADNDTVLGIAREVRTRSRNVDRQSTGADGFAPSIAGRVIDLQAQVAGLSTAVQALAAGTGADPALLQDAIDKAIRESITANVPTIAAVLEQGLADDLDGVRAVLAQLPDDVRATLKEAL